MTFTKHKSLMALAVAGSLTCAGAFAGGSHTSANVITPSSVSESAPWLTGQPSTASSDLYRDHGATSGRAGFGVLAGGDLNSEFQPLIEVQTPSSVNESAPWLTGQPHHIGTMNGPHQGVSVSDSGAFDSIGYESLRSEGELSPDQYAVVEYWLIGTTDESGFEIGSDSAISATNPLSSGSLDDMQMSMTEPSPVYLTEHYLVMQPSSLLQPGDYLVLESNPSAEDAAMLQALTGDFYVITPIYDQG